MPKGSEGVQESIEQARVKPTVSRPGRFSEATFGPATRLVIRVKQPETEHTVSVGKLQRWLDGGAKSPNEKVAKSRLKEILGK